MNLGQLKLKVYICCHHVKKIYKTGFRSKAQLHTVSENIYKMQYQIFVLSIDIPLFFC